MKIWFQNRRTKWKKQDNISNAEAAEHKNQATGKTEKDKKSGSNTPTTTTTTVHNTTTGPATATVSTTTSTTPVGSPPKTVPAPEGLQQFQNLSSTPTTTNNITISNNSVTAALSSVAVMLKPIAAATPDSVVNNRLGTSASNTSIDSGSEDHSNASIYTQDGSVSESYSEPEAKFLAVSLSDRTGSNASSPVPCAVVTTTNSATSTKTLITNMAAAAISSVTGGGSSNCSHSGGSTCTNSSNATSGVTSAASRDSDSEPVVNYPRLANYT